MSKATVQFEKDRRTQGKELGDGGWQELKFRGKERGLRRGRGFWPAREGKEPPPWICTAINIFLHPLGNP